MTSSSASAITHDTTLPYPSLAAMRTVHSQLLKRHREAGNLPELLTEIKDFIYRGRTTGTVLDRDEDRWAAQSLLDYWTASLYRFEHEPPDATLLEFDPSLAPTLEDSLCPYLGLEAFREKNKNLFFGRQRLVQTLTKHLKSNSFLAVVGSSGSGKSSVVLGGLLPQLKTGAISGSQNWHYYPPMVPGVDPLISLARRIRPPNVKTETWVQEQRSKFLHDDNHLLRLVSKSGGLPSILVIDQFEEVFTLCEDDQIRHAFINNLLELLQASKVGHRIIITMRTDFESRVARVPVLWEQFKASCVRVNPLDAGELREAIEKPAELVGLKFEEGLVDALLNDVLGEPAALPLLQFTLLKLWDHRDHNRVTWEAYQRLGGGRLALSRSADEFYNNLIPEEQVTVKRILLRMVRPGDGLEVTSNRIQRKELYRTGEAHDRVDRVLEKLIQARLIRLTQGETLDDAQVDDAQVEVAHEALVRNWSRLVDWLEDERVALRQRLELTRRAEQWQARRKESSLLLRGTLLTEARNYEDLNRLETEFVQKSLEDEKRRALLAQLVKASFAIGCVFLAVLSTLLYVQLQKTNRQRQEVENLNDALQKANEDLNQQTQQKSRALQTLSQTTNFTLLNYTLQTGLASAIQGVGRGLENPLILSTAESTLRTAINNFILEPKFLALYKPDAQRDVVVAYSPDNRYLITTVSPRLKPGGDAIVWWINDNQQLIRVVTLGNVTSDIMGVVVSSDGQLIFTAGKDSSWQLWNRQGQLLKMSPTQEERPDLRIDFATALDFTVDKRSVVIGSRDGTLYLWQWQDNQILKLFDQGEVNGYVTSVAVSTDNQLTASGYSNGTIRLWRINNESQLSPCMSFDDTSGYIVDINFKDGQTVLYTNADGSQFEWSLGQSITCGDSQSPPQKVSTAAPQESISNESWSNLLKIACNHPALQAYLKENEQISDPIRQEAAITCSTYVWNQQ
ncbi:MAG: hypothetical protein NW224_12280 [Leptolyngbyaceae cyanobacterium bins.302]|nr:hypothetical protein [Leptolyngbyaceae cyanobacterium bins.302]